jgi:hypothetical protein
MPIDICFHFVELISQQAVELSLAAVIHEPAEQDVCWHDKVSHSHLLAPSQLYSAKFLRILRKLVC